MRHLASMSRLTLSRLHRAWSAGTYPFLSGCPQLLAMLIHAGRHPVRVERCPPIRACPVGICQDVPSHPPDSANACAAGFPSPSPRRCVTDLHLAAEVAGPSLPSSGTSPAEPRPGGPRRRRQLVPLRRRTGLETRSPRLTNSQSADHPGQLFDGIRTLPITSIYRNRREHR